MANTGKISKVWSTNEKLWYDELRVIGPYDEDHYQKDLYSHLQTVFPDFYTLHYDKNIRQDGRESGSRPDFAMVRKDFQEWWIVEVETIKDKIKHVKKQIDDFTNGEYNAVIEAQYLATKNIWGLSKKDIYTATKNTPHVLVIVDDITSEWIDELEDLKPKICLFKLYRSKDGMNLFSVSGDYPYIFEDQTHCHFSSAMRNLLHVTNAELLRRSITFEPPVKENIYKQAARWLKTKNPFKKKDISDDPDVYNISYRGQISQWKRIDENNQVYLQPMGPVATRSNDRYVLRRTKNNIFILDLK